MNLEDFVATTLVDLAKGLSRANETLMGERGEKKGEHPVYFLLSPIMGNKEHNHIDFDLAVTVKAEQSGKAKGGGSITIFEAAAEGALSHSSESASRIKFKVLLSKTLA